MKGRIANVKGQRNTQKKVKYVSEMLYQNTKESGSFVNFLLLSKRKRIRKTTSKSNET